MNQSISLDGKALCLPRRVNCPDNNALDGFAFYGSVLIEYAGDRMFTKFFGAWWQRGSNIYCEDQLVCTHAGDRLVF